MTRLHEEEEDCKCLHSSRENIAQATRHCTKEVGERAREERWNLAKVSVMVADPHPVDISHIGRAHWSQSVSVCFICVMCFCLMPQISHNSSTTRPTIRATTRPTTSCVILVLSCLATGGAIGLVNSLYITLHIYTVNMESILVLLPMMLTTSIGGQDSEHM